MAGLVDIVDLGEAVVAQPLLSFCEVDYAADADIESVVSDGLTGSGALGESLGIGDDKAQVAVVGDAPEGLCAQNLRGRFDLPYLMSRL